MPIRAVICDSDYSDGTLFYNISVTNEGGKEWRIRKRYNNFKDLDRAIVVDVTLAQQKGKLPSTGIFGIRKSAKNSRFLAAREDGLNAYMAALCAQVSTLEQNPVLQRFFAPDEAACNSSQTTTLLEASQNVSQECQAQEKSEASRKEEEERLVVEAVKSQRVENYCLEESKAHKRKETKEAEEESAVAEETRKKASEERKPQAQASKTQTERYCLDGEDDAKPRDDEGRKPMEMTTEEEDEMSLGTEADLKRLLQVARSFAERIQRIEETRLLKGMKRATSLPQIEKPPVRPGATPPPHWPQRDGWEWCGVLGSGAYGTVYSCQDKAKEKRVAVKRLQGVFADLTDAERTLRETAILARLDTNSVIRIYEIVIPGDVATFGELYIVLELCDFDLRKLLRSSCKLSWAQSNTLCYNLLIGLNYIHSAGVYHRDLKPANVLVNENCDVKICDFNLARALGADDDLEKMEEAKGEAHAPPVLAVDEGEDHPPLVLSRIKTGHVVTRWYRAPELMLLQENYTEAIDMWSVGCIYAELLQKQDAYRGPLFPGERCSGLSDLSWISTGYEWSDTEKEQLQLIFEVIGTPSDEDALSFGSSTACDIVRDFREKRKNDFVEENPDASLLEIDRFIQRGSGLSAELPNATASEIDLLTKMLTFLPRDRIIARQALWHEVLTLVCDRTLETEASGKMVLELDRDDFLEESKLREQFQFESERLR